MSQSLREFVSDPEGAYPALKRGAQARLERETRALLSQEPTPETAFAKLYALHRLYLETQQLLDPERFVGMFGQPGEK